MKHSLPENDDPLRYINSWWAVQDNGGVWRHIQLDSPPTKQHSASFKIMHGPFETEAGAATFCALERKVARERMKEGASSDSPRNADAPVPGGN